MTASTAAPPGPRHAPATRPSLRRLRGCGLAAALLLPAAASSAHDLERTRVSIVFAPDGSFVADIANDPDWLKLRLASIPGPFTDRVVLWVDGREVRPETAQFIPGTPAVNRIRGRVPPRAQSLRWFYGLVIDPYPLTVRRADRRLIVEEVQGDAWSRAIDLSGQFHAPLLGQRAVGLLLAAVLLVPVALRLLLR